MAKQVKKDNCLSGIRLQAAQYTFSISKAVTVIAEYIYVSRGIRPHALRNKM